MTNMQISDRIREAAEQYEQARGAYYALNLDTCTDREYRTAHRAFVNAAQLVAERVLIDLSR